MQSATFTLHDPARARAFFEDKLAFTTGPVELQHLIRSHDNHINVIDVRAEEDFTEGHIPGAINLPQSRWQDASGLSKEKTNIIYCYSQVCHLAARACVALAAQGYPVMELEGGFAAWQEHDLDIEHEPTNRLRRAAERTGARR